VLAVLRDPDHPSLSSYAHTIRTHYVLCLTGRFICPPQCSDTTRYETSVALRWLREFNVRSKLTEASFV